MFLCILEMVNAVLSGRRPAGSRRERATSPILEGLKREDCRTRRPDAARKLGAVLAERGEVAYWIVAQDGWPRQNRHSEQRASSREQMRMRSAKLRDAAYRFICECRICDRSLHGLRLALARNIRLPRRMSVHIDETGEVRGEGRLAPGTGHRCSPARTRAGGRAQTLGSLRAAGTLLWHSRLSVLRRSSFLR